MIKKKALVIAPYPISNPQHGGQKRARAVVDFYKTLFQEVKFVGVFHRSHYEPDADSICLGQSDIIQQLSSNPYAGELIVGKAIDNDIHVRSHVAKILLEFKPDIVQVEQIYPYLGLRVLLKELHLNPILILSSQNIEYKMKEGIFASLELSQKVGKPIIQQTENLERQASSDADLVIAVSKSDAKEHRALGAKNVVVAPNGISKTAATESAKKHWAAYKKDHGVMQAITFIGSGHPPNWVGFIKMVGLDSTFLPNGAKILMGGGVSEYFKSEYKYDKKTKPYKSFWTNVLPLGHLTEDHLSGLLAESDIFLLPIIGGGGSNLKTAEAILSGKKIVASTYAFRGFERYAKLPNIYIVDTTAQFKKALVKAVTTPYVQPTKAQQRLAAQVQWQYCLAPLKNALHRAVIARQAIIVRQQAQQSLHDATIRVKRALRKALSID